MGVDLESFDKAKEQAIALARNDGPIILADERKGVGMLVRRDVSVSQLKEFIRGRVPKVVVVGIEGKAGLSQSREVGDSLDKLVNFLKGRVEGEETVMFDCETKNA